MAEGPINYSGLLTQLDFAPLQRGLQLRAQNRALEAEQDQRNQTIQLAQSKFTVQQQDDAAYRDALAAYSAKPTPEALRDIGMRFPDHQKALQDGADSYTTGQRNDLLKTGFSVLGALSAGNKDLASKTLQDRRDALAKGGINTEQTDAAIQMINAGKLPEAQAYVSYAMSGLVGSDHVAGVMESLGVGGKADDRRADNQRQDLKLKIDERRIANSERATDAAIARGDAASARAERAAN
ncbi:MAG: hypothetical protein EOP02_38345, partial [Proteobacteria bacterium]